MARVNEGSHSFSCHPQARLSTYGTTEPSCLYSPSVEHHRTVDGIYSRLAEGRRLSWTGWLGEILRWFARPNTVTHPSISRGGRGSNSRPPSPKTNVLPLDYRGTSGFSQSYAASDCKVPVSYCQRCVSTVHRGLRLRRASVHSEDKFSARASSPT